MVEPWYSDPRWLAIIVTGFISVVNFIWSRRDRKEEIKWREEQEKKRKSEREQDINDRKRERAEDQARIERREKANETATPALQSLYTLFPLLDATKAAMGASSHEEREAKMVSLQEKEFPDAFNALVRHLLEIDKMLPDESQAHGVSLRTQEKLAEVQKCFWVLQVAKAYTTEPGNVSGASQSYEALKALIDSVSQDVKGAVDAIRYNRE